VTEEKVYILASCLVAINTVVFLVVTTVYLGVAMCFGVCPPIFGDKENEKHGNNLAIALATA